MCETRAGILSALQRLVSGLDTDAMSAQQAKELVSWFSGLEHLAAAGKTLCAGRVASTGSIRDAGRQSAAVWLAGETGDSVGGAMRVLETAGQLKGLPVLQEAFRSGELSPAQGFLAAGAAAEDPTKENELLKQATSGSLRHLRRSADRIRAAARSEQDAQQRYEAVRARRSLRWWTDLDGAFRLDGRLTPDDGARLIAEIEPEARGVFNKARDEGRREPYAAYVADALVNLVSGEQGASPGARSSGAGSAGAGSPAGPGVGTASGSPGTSSAGPGDAVDHGSSGSPTGDGPAPTRTSGPGARSGPRARRRSQAVILRVDLAALRRGELEGEEVCEIPGVGPVPLAVARRLLGDAFLKLVISNGVDVQTVCHIGRHVSTFIETALQERDPTCVVPGCDAAVFLEKDHWQKSFAKGGPTDLANLCRLCSRHHHLKHDKGFILRGGPGKWEWIAPKEHAAGAHRSEDVPPWRKEAGRRAAAGAR
jgi:hypothetical protein